MSCLFVVLLLVLIEAALQYNHTMHNFLGCVAPVRTNPCSTALLDGWLYSEKLQDQRAQDLAVPAAARCVFYRVVLFGFQWYNFLN